MKDYSKDLENRVLTLENRMDVLMKNGSALMSADGFGLRRGNSLKA